MLLKGWSVIMNKEQIKIEINKCEWKINSYQSKINDLNKKVEELDKAYNRINKKYKEFCQNNSNKLNKLGKILIDSSNVPMSKKLYENMRQMYLGKDFQKAEQGFVQAMDKIKRKANDLYNEIDDYKAKLKKQQRQLLYLKQQLSIEMMKEGAEI